MADSNTRPLANKGLQLKPHSVRWRSPLSCVVILGLSGLALD